MDSITGGGGATDVDTVTAKGAAAPVEVDPRIVSPPVNQYMLGAGVNAGAASTAVVDEFPLPDGPGRANG